MKIKWIIYFALILLALPHVLLADEFNSLSSSKAGNAIRFSQKSAYKTVQVASFKNKKNATNFVRKLKNEGRDAVLIKDSVKGKKPLYKVLVKEKPALLKNTDVASRRIQEPLPVLIAKEEKTTPVVSDLPVYDDVKSTASVSDVPSKEIASYNVFSRIEDAESFSNQKKEDGYKVKIHSKAEKDDRVVYSVFAEKAPVNSIPAVSSTKDIPEPKPAVQAVKAAPVFLVAAVDNSPVPQGSIAKEAQPAANPAQNILSAKPVEDEPLEGTSKEKRVTASDIFGRKGGYIHPFFSVTEYYTDNVFNSRRDKESDFVTVLSPGVWMTVPHIYEKLLLAETSILSPGGFSLSRYKPETFRRYQTYLFYNADIELYSNKTSGNIVNHKAEGFFQYNLRGGLTFELIDQYLASHDLWGTGISGKLDKFRTNLADLNIMYNVSDRIMLRLDYSNYLVDYTATRNAFRDRFDNTLSAYAFYRFKPKTSVFYEYEFVDISYDDSSLSDSSEHHNFVGIQWDVTAKSKGSVKAGYGLKSFADSGISNSNEFVLEAQVDHKFTGKTSVILKASRKTNESNISTTNYMVSDSFQVEYLQKLTGKITGNASVSYARNEYDGKLTFNGITGKLTDDYITGLLALQYKFKEWLELDAGYILSNRDSSFSDFDYTTHTLFLRLTSSL